MTDPTVARLVFLSLFLGLVSGRQPVLLRGDAAVRKIVLELDHGVVATLKAPPWRAEVDFGANLEPRDLTAVAYDASGHEVGRTSQTINLPRPIAELEVRLLTPAGHEHPSSLELLSRHREGSPLMKAVATVDDKNVTLSKDLHAPLPKLNWALPHVVSAEVRFQDRTVAKREVVLPVGYSDAVQSQMTPVLLRTSAGDGPVDIERCFTLDGKLVHARALDRGKALIIVVKDPDDVDGVGGIDPARVNSRRMINALRAAYRFEAATKFRLIWPVGHRIAGSELVTDLLETTGDFDGSKLGLQWILTRKLRRDEEFEPRRVTDAVAVAGLRAFDTGGRRAVVLLLGERGDDSRNRAAAARTYLERIGVPFFVWSANGVGPEATATWGNVEDVSTDDGLCSAVEHLRDAIAQQRIAWLAAAPLDALRIRPSGDCGLTPVAQAQ